MLLLHSTDQAVVLILFKHYNYNCLKEENIMAALANHIMGGMGPAAAPPIYQGYQAQIMNPQQLHLMNV
jgi:hypothetical protein